MKNNWQKICLIFLTLVLSFGFFVGSVWAVDGPPNLGDASGKLDKFGGAVGYSTGTQQVDLEKAIGQILFYLLSFLGIIFMILTVYAGFLWMTAGGNEEQITKAKAIMKNSTIGLIIVVVSYAIYASVYALFDQFFK